MFKKPEGHKKSSETNADLIKRIVESNTREADEIQVSETPIVIVAADPNDMLRFIRKKSVAKCGRLVYETNYLGIYLTEDKLKGATNSIRTQDVKIEYYFNNKLDTIYHQNVISMEKMYHDLIQNDCTLNKEILKTKLAMAITNVDSVAPLLPLEKGEFGRVVGR